MFEKEPYITKLPTARITELPPNYLRAGSVLFSVHAIESGDSSEDGIIPQIDKPIIRILGKPTQKIGTEVKTTFNGRMDTKYAFDFLPVPETKLPRVYEQIINKLKEKYGMVIGPATMFNCGTGKKEVIVI